MRLPLPHRAVAAAVLLCVAVRAPAAAQRMQQYDVVVAEHNLMIPMRDGKRMATDIYRPARDGIVLAERLPVLLQRTQIGRASCRERVSVLV